MKDKLSYFFKGSFAVFISEGLEKLINFLFLPIYAIFLMPEHFGEIAWITTMVSVIALVTNPGVITATLRLYNDKRFEENKKQLFGNATIIFFSFVIIIIIGSSAFFIIKELGESSAPSLSCIVLGLVNACFIHFKRLWAINKTSLYKIKSLFILNIVFLLISTIVSLYSVTILETKSFGRLLGPAVAYSICTVYYVWDLAKFSEFKINTNLLIKQLKLGYSIVPTMIGLELLILSDKYFIINYLDLKSLGIYSLSMQVCLIITLIAKAIFKIFNPMYYELINNKKFNDVTKLIKIIYFIIGCLIIILSLVVPYLINNIFPSAYRECLQFIPYLLIIGAIQVVKDFSIASFIINYKTKILGIYCGVACIMNVIIMYALVSDFEIYGIISSIIISYTILIIALIMKSNKKQLFISINRMSLLFILVIIISIGIINRYLYI